MRAAGVSVFGDILLLSNFGGWSLSPRRERFVYYYRGLRGGRLRFDAVPEEERRPNDGSILRPPS
jgi:hypothetical protein